MRVEGCDFSYGWGWRRHGVFKNINLTFPVGRTVLLGPNGAGKSTLLSIAASVLSPSRGRVSLSGLCPAQWRDRPVYRRRVGWLPQHIRPVPGLRVREQVAYAGWLKGMAKNEAWVCAGDALAQVGMSDLQQRPANKLSGGQMRRMGIAQALVHEADVLLLDEPSAGLDPMQRRQLREVLRKLSGRSALVVSTHQIDDIDETYDNVIVLAEGQVKFQGTVAEFLALAPDQVLAAQRPEAAYSQLVAGEQ